MNKNEVLFGLIRQALYGADGNLKNEPFDKDTLKELYSISRKFDVGAIVASALVKNGCLNDSIAKERFTNEIFSAVMRYEKMNYALEKACGLFEKEKIPYVLLKGAVIRDLYPEKWMRTSCDIDILVKERDVERAAKALCEELSCKTDGKRSYHDVSLFSENGVQIELHYSIKENNEKIDKLLGAAWDYSERVNDGGFKYAFTNEFMIFHILSHAAYHLLRGGCGIRPLVDLYLLEKNLIYDEEKLLGLCREASLEKFKTAAEKLSRVWLENGEHDEMTERLENFIISGGIYGDVEKTTAIGSVKHGKFVYTLKRIFPPYSEIKIRYPILERHAYLTPVYQLRRLFGLLFGRGIGAAADELSVILNSDDRTGSEAISLINDLGLMQ